jgi:arylsulfatase A-like enzyme
LVVVTGDTATSFHTNIVEKNTARLILGNGGNLLEEVLHVPLFIIGPGIQNEKRDYLVQHIDIMPAISSLLGLPKHPALQGRNPLAPPTERQQKFAFHVAQTPAANQIAITFDKWRLVLDKMSGELFAHYLSSTMADPNEFKRLEAELLNNLLFLGRLQLGYYNDTNSIKFFYPPVITNTFANFH